ncbi:hypothetical protein ACHAWF_017496 [Thalassiosira exigua]
MRICWICGIHFFFEWNLRYPRDRLPLASRPLDRLPRHSTAPLASRLPEHTPSSRTSLIEKAAAQFVEFDFDLDDPMSTTAGAVARMLYMSDSYEDPTFTPVVQVLHIKRLENKNGNGDGERWKIVLSDGDLYLYGMVAPQLVPEVHSGEIARYSLLRVDEFIVHTSQSGLKVLILLGFRKVGAGSGTMIGKPQRLRGKDTTE